jgi:lysophospholipase L1-like esterase
VTAADTVTAHVDETIKSVAQSTGAVYVDLRTAFRGPDASWDETHLLGPDGDHPNAAGHRRIAQAIALTSATH